MLSRRTQAGDTLIEVLFAITVFSLIVVSALALMNQGSASAARSLETSLVRQQMDNQTETLRFLHESYTTNYRHGYSSDPNLTLTGPTGEFYTIVKLVNTTAATSSTPLDDTATTCPTPPGGSFILNTKTATVRSNPTIFRPATTYAQLIFNQATPTVLTSSEGLWIEAIRSSNSSDPSQSNSGYIDFHIHACWDAPGIAMPKHMSTIVRLYEPRG